ncbi:hypothetical protein [Pseudomonas aegrilactucae]|uniref:Uncharacterized protein n=1 Tax=Pseudomonas aegrilactucae TaxID=2854028 RepID=A0A9Q2XI27_9PSED|nr:hypothetical protein [Pseudomonas aegrilactucae]MBV6287467.1 hypothetical protein [Pseudomonas aegrilactucae]
MNTHQRTKMLELDLAAKLATDAQLKFTQEVYPKGCLVKIHHSRGAFNARVLSYSRDGHQLRVKNCMTGKQTYAYPSSPRTNTWQGEPWESSVKFLGQPDLCSVCDGTGLESTDLPDSPTVACHLCEGLNVSEQVTE